MSTASFFMAARGVVEAWGRSRRAARRVVERRQRLARDAQLRRGAAPEE
jgi:hypothetical protein